MIINFINDSFEVLKNRSELIWKKIRNRIPEKAVEFSRDYILPYGGIIMIAFFSLILNYAHAAEAQAPISADDVMDLDSTDVASIVNNLNQYTPNLSEDPVSVALSIEDVNFINKPIIVDTAETQTPATVPSLSGDNRSKTITYTVQDGDTLSSIGWTYGLKIATIKYANNLSSETIKPGQSIKLPPGDISPSVIAAATNKLKKVAGASTSKVNRKPGSSVNGYPWGWCTYYVATRRYVPAHWGNASSWLSSARSAGYATGSNPQAGAIVVTNESWAGHVAYVERVSGGSITISEMNARGFGIISSRTLSVGDGRIRGFIY